MLVYPGRLSKLTMPLPLTPASELNSATESGIGDQLRSPSLPESHRSIPIVAGASFFRKMLAFAGPGYLVAVGYMDPGNWATDLAGGARFGYSLLSVILVSNLLAVLLQALAAKLGIATGRDLAQACRDHYSRRVGIALWLIAEIAITACDLAEVIGSAIALNLLFHIPIPIGVGITALDVLVVLYLQNRGYRRLEIVVITLIATIALAFLFELVLAHPDAGAVARGFVPAPAILTDSAMLYIAISILGATVMPHNLYLHSSIVQTRRYEETPSGKHEAVRYAVLDSTVALTLAFFVNAAILVVAGATFHSSGHSGVAEIQDAYKLLTPFWVPAAPAWCSHWRCSRRGRTRRSPALSPARSSWKDFSASACDPGSAASSPAASPSFRPA